MIICYVDKEKSVKLRWRENGERMEKSVNDFKPYFFIRSIERQPVNYRVKERVFQEGRSRTVTITLPFEYENGNWVNIHGQSLTKVYVNKPGDVRTAREIWPETYEADVPFHYRYCVDNLSEVKEYKMRKWYWDMEWQQGGEYDGNITAIVVYDNYTEKFTTYTWLPTEGSEKEMLEKFIVTLQEQDPDMMIAWFGLKFDLPKLIHRLFSNGINPEKLSPYGDVKGVGSWGLTKTVDNYSPIEQPIRGRICLNLDVAFERQWNDAQRGTLPSMALDYVAETVLGTKKLVSEKFPDKNEFFSRGWLEDNQTYLEYAQVDVDLIRRIDEENFTSESIVSLQRLLKAPFDACFYASNMGSIYFMRHATWKAPTSIKKIICMGCHKEVPIKKKCSNCGSRIGDEYDGAMIYDPMSEGTNGLHLGVAAFDFAGLYPSMMLARNISWETKSAEPTDFAVNLKIPRDFSEVKEQDMRYYKTDKLGLLPTSVLELKTLRDEYKRRMNESRDDPQENKKWYVNQMAVKRLMASFYGIIAYRGFGWYDIDVAASITASAREAIRAAAFKVREI
jgi:DNA polymerase elongation subunit (family B)